MKINFKINNSQNNNQTPLLSLTKKDFRIDTFRCSGNGGQKINKTSSGVRITHIESGISYESCVERSQHQNKKIAFMNLIYSKEFELWLKKKAGEMLITKEEKKQLEIKIDKLMKEENLKIEYY